MLKLANFCLYLLLLFLYISSTRFFDFTSKIPESALPYVYGSFILVKGLVDVGLLFIGESGGWVFIERTWSSEIRRGKGGEYFAWDV